MDSPPGHTFKWGWRRHRHLAESRRSGRALRASLSRRWRRDFLRVFFIISALFIFYFFFLRLHLFEVKRVVCQNEDRTFGTAPYWCPFLQAELVGRNFFFFDILGVEKRFKEKYPEFRELFLQRDFPLVVKAEVREREALAFVVRPHLLGFAATPSAEALLAAGAYLVDEDSYLFRRSSLVTSSLPYLLYTENGELGRATRLSGVFWQFSLKILGGLKRLGLTITAVGQGDKGWLELSLRDGPVIYLSPEDKLDKTLAVLQLLIEKYKIEGKRLKKIDMRFKEPVVDY